MVKGAKMDKEMLMWIQNGDVVKGEINFKTNTVTFFDKFDNILMKRTGLNKEQLMQIKNRIQQQLDKRKHVGFYYL